MPIRRAPMFRSSEITDERLYLDRRTFLGGAIAGAAAFGAAAFVPAADAAPKAPTGAPLKATRNPAFVNPDPLNKIEDATSYNNFYEFGVNKDDPARLAGSLKTRPWTVKVDGLVAKPKTYDIDELLRVFPLEERVYALRCVEAWSMIIPWIGFPLAALLKQVEPMGNARFVEFVTLNDPNQFPGQKPGLFGGGLDWPYVEGLRLDEANHDLAFIATGIYGKAIPNQNGAPLRLVTPWKYGFKGVKSIVKFEFVAKQPKNTWNVMASNEYGFYANVNPNVDHPRWSQASERVIGGGGLLGSRQRTLMFNGYEKEVAGLYKGMDLKKNY